MRRGGSEENLEGSVREGGGRLLQAGGEEPAESGNEKRAWQMGKFACLKKCKEVSMVAKQNRKVKGDETGEPKREENCSVSTLC